MKSNIVVAVKTPTAENHEDAVRSSWFFRDPKCSLELGVVVYNTHMPRLQKWRCSMSRHMSFDERVLIQEGLASRKSFAEIGRRLGRNRSTISREVQRRKIIIPARGNVCIHRKECGLPQGCKTRNCTTPINCTYACALCRNGCSDFEEERCVYRHYLGDRCNACEKRYCRYERCVYDAKEAQKMYERDLSESRKGISLTESELEHLDRIVSKQIMQGISVPVICVKNADILPVSERTIYEYIDKGLLGVSNLELRRKVQRKLKKKTGPVLRVDKKCHIGRTYDDHLRYMEEHTDTCVCQMDTVIGKQGGKVLLTIFFTNCDLQLAFLRRRNTSRSVAAVFRLLRRKLGAERFMELFQVLLADRGSEFTDPTKIEIDTQTGELQCRVFYCDPQNSNQKAGCERNHELIRYIIPKGRSMDSLTQEDITKMMNHINSYPRKKWKGQSPIDLFKQIYGEETSTLLGLDKVDVDSILLKPELLKK